MGGPGIFVINIIIISNSSMTTKVIIIIITTLALPHYYKGISEQTIAPEKAQPKKIAWIYL